MPAPEWQPIETAPKDGTEVLVTLHEYGDPTKRRLYEVARYSERGAGWYGPSAHSPKLYDPTHWMLLPEPPES